MKTMTEQERKNQQQIVQPAAQQQRTVQQVQQVQQSQPVQQNRQMQGLSEQTAEKMNTGGQGYQPTDQATAANQALQQLMAQKPQGYTSKYSGQLEGILQQLQGQKFNYSLNADPFFQSLKDTQKELSRQAAMDTMGMAAGLTGGYGNSAAQAAANQAYQQGLLSLNDRALDAYNLALQRYQVEQQGLGNQFNMLNALEQNQYGQYRDTMGDWMNERDYLANRADTEYNRGYNEYLNDQNYWLQRAQVENAAYNSEEERQEAIRQFDQQYALQQAQFDWNRDVDQRDYDRGVLESDRAYNRNVLENDRAYNLQQAQFDYGKEQDAIDNALRQEQFKWQQNVDQRNYDRDVLESDRAYELNKQQIDESIRQFNESLNWDKMNSAQKYAAQYALAILENGQMPSAELLASAGLSSADAEKLIAQIATGGGSGSGGSKKTTYYPDITGENYYVKDANGNYQLVNKNDIDYKNGVEDTSQAQYLTAKGAVQNAWSQAAAKQQQTKAEKEQIKKDNQAKANKANSNKQSKEVQAMVKTIKNGGLQNLLFGK